jgi:hypothetical protein
LSPRNRTYQGQGHARALLLFALTPTLRASREIASFGALAHPIDEQVRQFYRRWGFEDLRLDLKRPMILRMVDLEKSGLPRKCCGTEVTAWQVMARQIYHSPAMTK